MLDHCGLSSASLENAFPRCFARANACTWPYCRKALHSSSLLCSAANDVLLACSSHVFSLVCRWLLEAYISRSVDRVSCKCNSSLNVYAFHCNEVQVVPFCCFCFVPHCMHLFVFGVQFLLFMIVLLNKFHFSLAIFDRIEPKENFRTQKEKWTVYSVRQSPTSLPSVDARRHPDASKGMRFHKKTRRKTRENRKEHDMTWWDTIKHCKARRNPWDIITMNMIRYEHRWTPLSVAGHDEAW